MCVRVCIQERITGFCDVDDFFFFHLQKLPNLNRSLYYLQVPMLSNGTVMNNHVEKVSFLFISLWCYEPSNHFVVLKGTFCGLIGCLVG